MNSDFPPRDIRALHRFPSVDSSGMILHRIHRADSEAAYFGNRGLYRFDPPRHMRDAYGTCYLATSPVGAFLETLGGIRPLPEHLINERVISELVPQDHVTIADLTAEQIVGDFGIFGDLSASEDYHLSQEWGSALWQAGFNGVFYYASHDPAFRQRSIALFGPPGVHPDLLRYLKDDGQPEPISSSLLSEMRRSFGIEVIPAAPLDTLPW